MIRPNSRMVLRAKRDEGIRQLKRLKEQRSDLVFPWIRLFSDINIMGILGERPGEATTRKSHCMERLRDIFYVLFSQGQSR
mmetsp:Transcript_12237/g.18488  ORF Transcript_12237/g.18488 Transcript_12237/m.18488 type:complete len:81 (-) Transcript_12237:81-323(-)